VKFGVFEGESLRTTWRIATDATKLADEYAVLVTNLLQLDGLDRKQIDAAVIASVVPALTPVFEELCRQTFNVKALRLGAGVKTGLRVLYEDPREVGPDRIAGAVAALAQHGPPLIVVHLGTATVFEAISQNGEYLGGAIAPGIGVAASALADRAAMLRSVDLRPPRKAVANNTTAAMQSGILFGYTELIEGMIRRFKAEIGENAWVIGTGGWAALISQLTKSIDTVDEHLTLTGLRLIYEMNGPDA
jgi:type III pantothenate kinase